MEYFPGRLDEAAQTELLAEIRRIIAEAPLFVPTMPRSGTPMSVRMTNCGRLGWVTDKEHGYRYQATHPVTGKPWPPIPKFLLDLWEEVAGYPAPPEACLVNYYAGAAKMGLHQDKDEEDFGAPVLSVSLGDTGIFRVGGSRARTLRRHSSSSQVMWSSWAERTGSLITASTASCPALRIFCRRVAASISRCGG